MFYLNYVGCKVDDFQGHIGIVKKFYLNYVGCKEVHPQFVE